jgi:hypothetical protein
LPNSKQARRGDRALQIETSLLRLKHLSETLLQLSHAEAGIGSTAEAANLLHALQSLAADLRWSLTIRFRPRRDPRARLGTWPCYRRNPAAAEAGGRLELASPAAGQAGGFCAHGYAGRNPITDLRIARAVISVEVAGKNCSRMGLNQFVRLGL